MKLSWRFLTDFLLYLGQKSLGNHGPSSELEIVLAASSNCYQTRGSVGAVIAALLMQFPGNQVHGVRIRCVRNMDLMMGMMRCQLKAQNSIY